ncbi:MAG: hypothetical protein DMG40_20630 [Acidobacteria bacterium]|nr:MAG: hypothetical protein DMG40_20630 [Acidobacteriota bacterium]
MKKSRKVLLLIASMMAILTAVQLVRSHIEEQRHYVTVDSVTFTNRMPDAFRATVHSRTTTYVITCTDYTDRRDGSVRPCQVLGVSEVIRFGTVGDLMVFFDGSTNSNSWTIEREVLRGRPNPAI